TPRPCPLVQPKRALAICWVRPEPSKQRFASWPCRANGCHPPPRWKTPTPCVGSKWCVNRPPHASVMCSVTHSGLAAPTPAWFFANGLAELLMSQVYVHGIGAVSPAGWGLEPLHQAVAGQIALPG